MSESDATTFPHDVRAQILARATTVQPPPTFEDLAAQLDITSEEERRLLDELLLEMMLDGDLVRGRDGAFRPAGDNDFVGRVNIGHAGRLTLIMPLDRSRPPVRIPRKMAAGAKHGDIVHATFISDDEARELQRKERDRRDRGFNRRDRRRKDFRKRYAGTGDDADDTTETLRWAVVQSVVKSRPQRMLGVIESVPHRGFRVRILRRDAPKSARIVGTLPAEAERGAIVDVVLEPDPDKEGREVCRVLAVKGSILRPEDDELAVIAEFGLRTDYDPVALKEVQVVMRDAEAEALGPPRHYREDLSHLPVIAIDPEDARDHDDAMSLENHDDGTFTIGIHIADVSHFVPSGSALDEEARLRGCTVYFPRGTLHMLPPDIARHVCSLRPGLPKLAKSVFITYNAQGTVLRRWLVRSVVKIGALLDYGKAKRIIRGEATPSDLDDLPEWVPDELKAMRRVADVLNRDRRSHGSFELHIPRPRVMLDQKKERMVRVVPDETDESHNLVEEFMLAANQAVARFLHENGLPYIGRVHPPPEPETIGRFEEFLYELGFDLPEGFSPQSIQGLLDKLGRQEGGEAVHLALLKSMQRAVYSHEPGVHYALQFRHYSHFTSPIRRYPDLIAHQIVDAYIDRGGIFSWTRDDVEAARQKGLAPKEQQRFEMMMPIVAHASTESSIRADRAETRANELKILWYIERHHLGDEVMATVTGGSRNGIFAQLDGFLIDGMIVAESMGAEAIEPVSPFSVDAWIRGRPTRFRVGDRVKVRLAFARPVEGELDLELAEAPRSALIPGPRGSDSGHRNGKPRSSGGKPKSPRGGQKSGRAAGVAANTADRKTKKEKRKLRKAKSSKRSRKAR